MPMGVINPRIHEKLTYRWSLLNVKSTELLLHVWALENMVVPHVQDTGLRSEKICLIKDICRKSGLLSRNGMRKTLLLYQMCALTFSGDHGDSTKHNSITLLFCMCINTLFSRFCLEKLSLGFFWIWKTFYVSSGLLSPFFSHMFQLPESAGWLQMNCFPQEHFPKPLCSSDLRKTSIVKKRGF